VLDQALAGDDEPVPVADLWETLQSNRRPGAAMVVRQMQRRTSMY
jgi:hypothetical protein